MRLQRVGWMSLFTSTIGHRAPGLWWKTLRGFPPYEKFIQEGRNIGLNVHVWVD